MARYLSWCSSTSSAGLAKPSVVRRSGSAKAPTTFMVKVVQSLRSSAGPTNSSTRTLNLMIVRGGTKPSGRFRSSGASSPGAPGLAFALALPAAAFLSLPPAASRSSASFSGHHLMWYASVSCSSSSAKTSVWSCSSGSKLMEAFPMRAFSLAASHSEISNCLLTTSSHNSCPSFRMNLSFGSSNSAGLSLSAAGAERFSRQRPPKATRVSSGQGRSVTPARAKRKATLPSPSSSSSGMCTTGSATGGGGAALGAIALPAPSRGYHSATT
mmetsp:Transcript_74564/g.242100  ORF Transcript_74564/g.242100 Transcript_74564/m.242100 type:complete len:270 (+) Transcript_74564:2623-3432(+)